MVRGSGYRIFFIRHCHIIVNVFARLPGMFAANSFGNILKQKFPNTMIGGDYHFGSIRKGSGRQHKERVTYLSSNCTHRFLSRRVEARSEVTVPVVILFQTKAGLPLSVVAVGMLGTVSFLLLPHLGTGSFRLLTLRVPDLSF